MNLPAIDDIRAAKVLVVGDLMLDRYWSGATRRVSPEAPVPVVKIDQEYERLGGCGNVAANITAIDAHAYLLAALGDDEAAASVEQLARKAGINCHLVKDRQGKTTVKLRVISQQQQLLRLDFENGVISAAQNEQLEAQFERFLDTVGAVVISDYGKGGVPTPAQLIARAGQFGVPVIVDPKGRDFEKYRGAYLVTPNFREFEEVVGECADEKTIEDKARRLLKSTGINALLVTRGDKGMSLVQNDQPMFSLSADSKEVFDVTGAGDTVCGVLAAAISAGCELRAATTLANKAAGIVVAKFGTATVSMQELGGAVETGNAKVWPLANLVELVRDKRHKGDKIVMTNGCFDVLHAGHVDYLRRAKTLGNFLIVAVNTDASVKRLKGKNRPFNTLDNRLQVLAALETVDAVVAFDEDTPLELIKSIVPDVLVKGGDYEIPQIVGADVVTAAGGEVSVLPFLEGLSSSSIIKKLENEK